MCTKTDHKVVIKVFKKINLLDIMLKGFTMAVISASCVHDFREK